MRRETSLSRFLSTPLARRDAGAEPNRYYVLRYPQTA